MTVCYKTLEFICRGAYSLEFCSFDQVLQLYRRLLLLHLPNQNIHDYFLTSISSPSNQRFFTNHPNRNMLIYKPFSVNKLAFQQDFCVNLSVLVPTQYYWSHTVGHEQKIKNVLQCVCTRCAIYHSYEFYSPLRMKPRNINEKCSIRRKIFFSQNLSWRISSCSSVWKEKTNKLG